MDTEQLKHILQNFDTIINAFIFGSYAANNQHILSDIDIAIETTRDLDLFEMGEIIAAIETASGKKTDLVILNDLHKKSPLLTYNIYKNHKILFLKSAEKYMLFKENALHYYLDFKPVIDEQNSAFAKRIEDGNLAKIKTA